MLKEGVYLKTHLRKLGVGKFPNRKGVALQIN